MSVTPIRMPKWGLSMQEGTVVNWWKEEGAEIAEGDELADIETSKITNVYEAPFAGTLRRIVAQQGETLPVGALIGVVADESASDAEVDAFIAEFQANFVPEEVDEAGGGLALSQVEAAGRSIRIGKAGEGDETPIVLLHGYSGDLNNWLFNLEALAASAPVIALDLPGHGGSSKDVGDGSLAVLASAVSAALDELKIAKAHLIGHSLGGAVAARIAADRPERIASLSLICPAYLPGTVLNEEFLTGIAEAQRARDIKPFLEMLFADPSAVTRDMTDDMIKYKRLDGVEEVLAAIRDRMVAGDDGRALASDLANISGPVHVIASKGDQIVGIPDKSALPANFKLHEIDGAGHMPHLEKAAEVNALLLAAVG